MTSRLRAGAALATVLLAAGCASSGATKDAADPALPSTAPYLQLTGADSGIAVWPSGSAWVLLSTDDGFRHVTNRTPQGVETNGGLVVATTSGAAVVAVGAHERLLRSPVLTTDHTWRWDAGELPGAVAGSRGAVTAAPATAVVTAHRGTLERRTASGWTPVVAASTLAPGLTVNAVGWASTRVGWLTGSGHGIATAYGTQDGGATWTPVPHTAGEVTGGLPPCGSGPSWVLPTVRSDGTLVVLRTSDTGAHWTAGAPVRVGSAAPVIGCAGAVVWVDASDWIRSSADGGASWSERGAAPADLSDLTPTVDGTGFAASGGSHPALWRVTGDGSRFIRITLPDWVSALGEEGSDGS